MSYEGCVRVMRGVESYEGCMMVRHEPTPTLLSSN